MNPTDALLQCLDILLLQMEKGSLDAGQKEMIEEAVLRLDTVVNELHDWIECEEDDEEDTDNGT